MHPSKMLAVSQFHIFTILALFPAFMHAPPFLRAFDFPKEVAAKPPTILAFLLFQVCPRPKLRILDKFISKWSDR